MKAAAKLFVLFFILTISVLSISGCQSKTSSEKVGQEGNPGQKIDQVNKEMRGYIEGNEFRSKLEQMHQDGELYPTSASGLTWYVLLAAYPRLGFDKLENALKNAGFSNYKEFESLAMKSDTGYD